MVSAQLFKFTFNQLIVKSMQDRLDYLVSQCPEDENAFAIAEEEMKVEDENDPEYQK